MIRFVRSVSALVLGGFLALSIGCGGSGGSSSGGGGSDATTGSSNGQTTGSGASCAMMCSTGQECENLVCNCNDGSPVNTTACNNSCCATKAEACPGSCEDHGGWADGTSASTTGSGSSGAAFGDSCFADSDCQSNICFHVDVDDESVQKCTKTCSFGGGECGAGWDCAEITLAGETSELCILQ